MRSLVFRRRNSRRSVAPVHAATGALLAVCTLMACDAAVRPGDASILEREEDARELYARGDWRDAAHAWGELTTANPDRAAYWQNFAYSLYASEQYDEAAAAWKTALRLGYNPPHTLYNLACVESLRLDHAAAMDHLEAALVAGWDNDALLWNDTDLDPLRRLPAFRGITGVAPPAEEDRVKRWSYDLDHLRRRMEMLHHDLYATVEPAVFAAELDRLEARIGSISDDDVLVDLQRIVAMIGDGHTAVDLVAGPFHHDDDGGGADRRPDPTYLAELAYPVELYRFSDGLFVRDAGEAFENLVGAEVVRIGGFDADEAIRRVEPYCSRDNTMGLAYMAPLRVALPAVAEAAGLVETDGRLALTLDRPPHRVLLDPVPMLDARSRYRRRTVRSSPDASAPPPPYLRRPVDPFWWEHDTTRGLVYFQFNLVQDLHGSSLEQTVSEMFEYIEDNDIEVLVIDLRHNTGGNNNLIPPLIRGVIACSPINRRGHLFVITGRRTFSAAMNCATRLNRDTEALFVGEPTGSRPNFVGERSLLTLPYSGVRVSVSSRYWQDAHPTDARVWLAPHLPAPLSSEAWRANRDPAMEAIDACLRR